jgi:unsaturated chondroitin disaccharide hydrolase
VIRHRVAVALTAVLTAVVLPTQPATAAPTCPDVPVQVDASSSARAWDIAAPHLAALAGPASFPFGATGSSSYRRTSAYAWTSGFYPASLWLTYERTGDPVWLDRARIYTARVLPVARWDGSHDLGFMIGLPASLGRRLDPSPPRQARYDLALADAARSLSSRWNGRVGAIRSGYYGGRWGLIIDSAMNAPLLIETGKDLGGREGRRLEQRGLRHLLTLIRTFIRADGSTRHRLAFDRRTGEVIGPIPGQGLSAASTWSRGQAWAVNGFTRGYRLTGDRRLLKAARRTADYWTSRVPAGCVPPWDLDDDRVTAPHDSSAAAIAADGLLSLADIEPDAARADRYRDYALTTLGTLVQSPWVTRAGRGVLKRQAYNVPADRREGTYAWGDTYLLSALASIE